MNGHKISPLRTNWIQSYNIFENTVKLTYVVYGKSGITEIQSLS